MHVKRAYTPARVVAPRCAKIQCRELRIAVNEYHEELASARAPEEICKMVTILRAKPAVNAENRRPHRERQIRSPARTVIANAKDDRPSIGTRRYGGACVQKWFRCV